VILLAMSAFHGLSMTPTWDGMFSAMRGWAGLGELAAFSVGMGAVIVVPIVLFLGVCQAMKWSAGDRKHSATYLFMRFSYSLLPIALFYHLAHNLQHMFSEGWRLVTIASDPFGWGWNLFGTAGLELSTGLPPDVAWWSQVALILIGHVFGILIAHRIATSLYANPRQATASQIPILIAMVLFSLQSLWLLAQPMVMRTAM